MSISHIQNSELTQLSVSLGEHSDHISSVYFFLIDIRFRAFLYTPQPKIQVAKPNLLVLCFVLFTVLGIFSELSHFLVLAFQYHQDLSTSFDESY